MLLVIGCAQGGTARTRRDAGRDGGPAMDAGGVDGAPGDAPMGPPETGVDAARDAGPPCAEMPCRLVVPQCGCADGEGCYLGADGMRACLPAGRVAYLARCAGASVCQPGYLCVGSRGQNFCQKLCAADADCDGGALCVGQLGDGMGGTVPGVLLCGVSCDPIGSTPCPTGSACTIAREAMGAMRFYTMCRAAGMVTEGVACADARDCLAGLVCVGPEGGATTCQRYCLAATGTGCGPGTACTQFSDMPVVGGIEYGACL